MNERRVQDVIVFMRDNIGQELSMRRLAEEVKLSSSQLNTLFKAETGTTAMQYLKRLRMERARELLDTTYMSVKETAAAVGFDASHFVRDFKQLYGQTPKQYSKQRRPVIKDSPSRQYPP
jgi:transcriptional regulator GlxA family with amidase domain